MARARITVIVIGSLLAAIALVTCGGNDRIPDGTSTDGGTTVAPGGDATDDDTSVSSPPLEPDPGGVPDLAPAPVEPAPGASDPRPAAVERFVADAASPVVEVWFWGGVAPCSVLAGVEVDEGPDVVTVTVRTGASPEVGPEVACVAMAQLFSATVELSAPLGSRQLVDGAA